MSTEYESLDWYDIPRYYDIVFDTDTQTDANFLEEACKQYCRPESRKRALRVLEPACGSGRLVLEMARRGYKVTGIDLSDPMLSFARERLNRLQLKAHLKKADMADFKTRADHFDMAHCLVSSFKYLLSESDAVSHLKSVARALRPGGIYVLAFHLSDYSDTSVSRERWVAERDGTRVVCTITGWPPDRKRRLENVRSRIVVTESDGQLRKAETNWQFRTYNVNEARRLLAAVPELQLLALHDFAMEIDYTRELDDGQLDTVFILRKTG